MSIDELLRHSNPVPAPTTYSPAEQDRLLQEIRQRIASQVRPVERPRRLLRTSLLFAAATAAVFAIAVSSISTSTSPLTSPQAHAAEILNRAAMTLLQQPPSPPKAEAFLEVHSFGESLLVDGAAAWLTSFDRTEFVPRDPDQRTWITEELNRTVRAIRATTGSSNRPQVQTFVWAAAPRSSQRGGWALPTPEFLDGLPRDTAGLRARLYRDVAVAGGSSDAAAFAAITDVLSSGLASSALQATLYQVLATVPGVRVTLEDPPSSKLATTFTIDASGDRREVTIDRKTGDLVALRIVLSEARDGLPAGTVLHQKSVVTKPVAAVPASLHRAINGPCPPGPRPNGCFAN